MRTFAASGLSVLHTPPYGSAAFASRLVGLLTLAGPRTTVEVAQEEDLPIGLTQEMVDEVETPARYAETRADLASPYSPVSAPAGRKRAS
ncbi:hypothetical protein NUW54_g14555 [Trametes sanguinea]|uniref:Uncharacterized protein n=1 Tax=Trametes sanguinea TaxID=158606 RepID=A0ACC1MBJ5_9APHY|nr:hypothetical protein NUW54_g14555 [Trametes sanguinea]